MQAVAHVRCFQQFHPPPPKPDWKAERMKAEQKHKGQAADDTGEGAEAPSKGSAEADEDNDPAATNADAAAAAAAGSPDGADAAGGSWAALQQQQQQPSAGLANGKPDNSGSLVDRPEHDSGRAGANSIAAAVSDSKLAGSMGGLPPLENGTSLQMRTLPPIRTIFIAEEPSSEAE